MYIGVINNIDCKECSKCDVCKYVENFRKIKELSKNIETVPPIKITVQCDKFSKAERSKMNDINSTHIFSSPVYY